MQVFVYEYFTGGGASELPQDTLSASLMREAAAMVTAVIEDFAALPAVRVVTTRDGRWPAFRPPDCSVVEIASSQSDLDVIDQIARNSDWTLLIAPETAGTLLERARLVEHVGGQLISPSSKFIEIAADKQQTADALGRAGLPVPQGCIWSAGKLPVTFPFPALIKPIDGCGSQDIRLLNSAEELRGIAVGRLRLEEFVPGIAASVSVLCGPNRIWPLIACEQRLACDGTFSYLGGRLPLSAVLDRRARRLAQQAIEALPPTIGYVGLDLVLGEAADGSGDRVIEANPRLTTSYVGLRAASKTNLAAAMLAAASGEEPVLRFRLNQVEFTSAGEIRLAGTQDELVGT